MRFVSYAFEGDFVRFIFAVSKNDGKVFSLNAQQVDNHDYVSCFAMWKRYFFFD